MKWKSLKTSKPPVNKLVEVSYQPTGAGSPERKAWKTLGRLRDSGIFHLQQNKEKTVDFNLPTHWKNIE